MFRSSALWVVVGAVSFGLGGCNGDDGASTGGSDTAAMTDSTTAPTGSSSGSNSNSNSNSDSDSESEGGSMSESATGTTSPTTGTTSDTETSGGSSAGTTTTTGGVLTQGTDSDASTSTGMGTGTDSDSSTSGSTGGDCMGDGGLFDFSYLWVANTSQGGISKIATDTMVEEGRYTVDANPGGASSSRTAVSLDGRFVVVANRGTGTITKVAADELDCVDLNNDGFITTSQGKGDVLAFGADECRIWTSTLTPPPVNYVGGPRGLAWEPGTFNQDTCKYENPSVWVGWHTNNGFAYMGRFNGETGEQTDTVELKDWPSGHAPYGAAMDGFGNLWFNSVFTGDIFRINTQNLGVQRWFGGGSLKPYGNTVDVDGNFWLAGYGAPITYFDAENEIFVSIPGTNGRHRGIAIDGQKRVWAATNNGGTNYGCGLVQVDGETKTFVKFHTLPQCSTPVGVSIDTEGFIWVVDYAGWAFKINGDTLEMEQIVIADVHYTYSDMTGGGLKGVIVPG